MTNLLRRGQAWLATKVAAAGGIEMLFLRRGLASFEFTGTPADHADEIADEDGFTALVRYREVIVTTSTLNGIEPRSGDRWQEVDDGKIYEVGTVGQKPGFEPLGEAGVMSVIRGKLVKG